MRHHWSHHLWNRFKPTYWAGTLVVRMELCCHIPVELKWDSVLGRTLHPRWIFGFVKWSRANQLAGSFLLEPSICEYATPTKWKVSHAKRPNTSPAADPRSSVLRLLQVTDVARLHWTRWAESRQTNFRMPGMPERHGEDCQVSGRCQTTRAGYSPTQWLRRRTIKTIQEWSGQAHSQSLGSPLGWILSAAVPADLPDLRRARCDQRNRPLRVRSPIGQSHRRPNNHSRHKNGMNKLCASRPLAAETV
jgi:hypothetical protein